MAEEPKTTSPHRQLTLFRDPGSIFETLIAGLPSVTALGVGSVYVLGSAVMLSQFMASGVPFTEGFLLVPTGQLLASGLSISLILIFVAVALVAWIAAFPEFESAWHQARQSWFGRLGRVTGSARLELDEIRIQSTKDRTRFEQILDASDEIGEFNESEHRELDQIRAASEERDRRLTKLERSLKREKLIFSAPSGVLRLVVLTFTLACIALLDVVVLISLVVAIGVVAIVEPPRRFQLPLVYMSLVGALIVGTLTYEPRVLPTATVTTQQNTTTGYLIAFSDSQWFLYGRNSGENQATNKFIAVPIDRVSETTIVAAPARKWRTLLDLFGISL